MNIRGFSQYRGLDGVEFMPTVPATPVHSDRQDDKKDILDLIFATDLETGFPTGALSHYLNDSTRPEIKKFIEDNILRDIPLSEGIENSSELGRHFKDLSDDFKFDVMRGRYEDVESYKERITNTLKEMAESEKNKAFVKKLYADYKEKHKDEE